MLSASACPDENFVEALCHTAAISCDHRELPLRRTPTMQAIIRAATIAIAFSLSCTGAALAQGKQPAARQAPAAKQAPAGKQAPPEPAGPQQIALTDQQVQGFITATPEIGKITANLKAEPDQK